MIYADRYLLLKYHYHSSFIYYCKTAVLSGNTLMLNTFDLESTFKTYQKVE